MKKCIFVLLSASLLFSASSSLFAYCKKSTGTRCLVLDDNGKETSRDLFKEFPISSTTNIKCSELPNYLCGTNDTNDDILLKLCTKLGKAESVRVKYRRSCYEFRD